MGGGGGCERALHGMATFACATFMNVGARGARHAPALFLSGSAAAAASSSPAG